jgi:hypothetical protein
MSSAVYKPIVILFDHSADWCSIRFGPNSGVAVSAAIPAHRLLKPLVTVKGVGGAA